MYVNVNVCNYVNTFTFKSSRASAEHLLDSLHRCIHLSNNSIQKHYKNGERAEELPDENMWHCNDFKEYLKSVAHF